MKATTAALTAMSYAYAGMHYLVLDPSKMDACNVIQARVAFTKMASLLFNSDSLSGNTAATQDAVRDPEVWRRVNSLSPPPAGGESKLRAGRISARGECDDIFTLIEVATTVGAGYASGEMSPDELAETINDLIDSHVKSYNLTKLSITPEELRSKYYTSGVTTPLLTIPPSCTKIPFALPNEATFDWNSALVENARRLINDVNTRYDNCNNCAEPFFNTLAQVAEVSLPENFVQKLTTKMRQQVDLMLNNAKVEELPHTLGSLLAYAVKKQARRSAAADVPRRSSAEVSNMAETVVSFLDALRQEMIEGPGPISQAIDKFYHDMGC